MTSPASAVPHTKRRTSLPLVRDPVFERLSLGELRLARQVLVDEVERATYWRRVLGVQAGSMRVRRSPMTPVTEMQRALSQAGRSPERMSRIPGGPATPTQLPDLVQLYSRAMEPEGHPSTEGLSADLASADRCLSDYRSELQGRVDRLTNQLVVRYKEAPSLALLLLPPPADPSSSSADVISLHDHHHQGPRRGQGR